MSKRGQSISINTIIIAAIALAVLVVLFMIFTGRLGLFSKGVQETTNCPQACDAAGYDRAKGEPADSCIKPKVELFGYYVIEGSERKKCCCEK